MKAKKSSKTTKPPLPINLRCYVKNKEESPDYLPKDSVNASSSNVLVFDTETTADEYQNLLFGSCGIWSNGNLKKFYIFYADDLPQEDVKTIKDYCSEKGYEAVSRNEFVDDVFLPNVYDQRARCVAFNMPFDVSRIAVHFDKPQRLKTRKFENGFTFRISQNERKSYVRIKNLNSKASFVEFTRPSESSETKKKKKKYKGYFLDLKTLTFVQTNNSYTLADALKDYECSPKSEAKEHGIINPEYLDYNVNDTMVTHELYEKTMERYKHNMLSKDACLLYSPATIGKSYLEKIGIKSFFEKNRKFPPELLGCLMMTYYGGRTEVRIRKEPVRASYIDFTSMYPSIFVLLGMYDFLISEKIKPENTRDETQKFLNEITLEDINCKDTWKRFATICKIVPDNDILPVRSTYHEGTTGTNIGINYLKSKDGTSLWYTLPDLVASKILSGKTPIIEDAITFTHHGVQKDLKKIEILKGIPLEAGEDFIKKLIEERMRIKSEIKEKAKSESYSKHEKTIDKTREHILKIIANATSYGIFIQVNSSNEDESEKHKVTVYGLESFETEVGREETPGTYFNPIMSVFLTAGSRLILAVAEKLVENDSGRIAYCDTDSVFVSPKVVEKIQEFFKPLNPYDEKNLDMFKIEDAEGELMKNKLFYGISAKRYVLYDYNEYTKEITIYKHSAHGLGHLRGIDEKKWWENILKLHYNPELKKEILREYENQYAVSKVSISTYNIMNRFKEINKRHSPYKSKIKPFNFATIGTGYRLDPETKQPIIPFMPYASPDEISEVQFKRFVDYKTGKLYTGNTEKGELDTEYYWKPMSAVFKDYVDHPESKFDGKIGELKRKHLRISSGSIRYVGKETNELDRAEVTGAFPEDETQYTDYCKILMTIKPSRDWQKVGLSRRHIIELQKKCRKGRQGIKDNIKKKLLRFQNSVIKI